MLDALRRSAAGDRGTEREERGERREERGAAYGQRGGELHETKLNTLNPINMNPTEPRDLH